MPDIEINDRSRMGTYTTSARSSMTMRPAGAPPMVMSKNTCGFPIMKREKEQGVG